MDSWRILMYSSGLEGARCTLAIASQLLNVCPPTSFLILTDSPIFGRFRLPPNLDYVHLPHMSNGLRGFDDPINPLQPNDPLLAIRRNIILSTVKSFDPHLLIVDRSPLGLRNEIYDTLTYLQKYRPTTKTVLGLVDIPGDADVIRTAWKQARVYETLRYLYDEIWVYGTPEIFDHAQEYAIPEDIAQKIVYTGYLRHRLKRQDLYKKLATDGIDLVRPFVFVTVGGGSDGYRLADNYLGFLESTNGHGELQSYIVRGQPMSSANKHALDTRAAKMPGVSLHRFHEDLSLYMYLATLVVSTSDYNTCCQILSFQKKAVIVPRRSLTSDQLLRAQVFQRHGVVEMVHPMQLTPERLGQKILEQTSQRQLPTPLENYNSIPLTGLDNIAQRVMNLCGIPEYDPAAMA